MIRYCPTCGEKIEEGARFCSNCGISLSEEFKDTHAYELKDEEFEDEETSAKTTQAKESDVTKALGIIIIIAMWVAVASTFYDVISSFGLDFVTSFGRFIRWFSDPAIRVFVGLIPLAWRIPLSIGATIRVRNKKKFEVGYGVVCLLFVHIIAGILMFIYNPEGKKNNKK